MKKIFSVFLMVAVLLGLVACASGNALVTGTQRPATNPESVVIYTEAPEKYEVIGIVNASSDATGSAQTDLNYAVAELKSRMQKLVPMELFCRMFPVQAATESLSEMYWCMRISKKFPARQFTCSARSEPFGRVTAQQAKFVVAKEK